jgi:hypothetical protein
VACEALHERWFHVRRFAALSPRSTGVCVLKFTTWDVSFQRGTYLHCYPTTHAKRVWISSFPSISSSFSSAFSSSKHDCVGFRFFPCCSNLNKQNTRILGAENPQFSPSSHVFFFENRAREHLPLLLTRTFPIKTHQERIGFYREHLPLVQTLQRPSM